MTTRLKSTRKVTYRKWGVPAIILEGNWLKKMYGWKIGDQISVEFQPNEIRLRNVDAEIARDLGKARSKNKNSPKGVGATN